MTGVLRRISRRRLVGAISLVLLALHASGCSDVRAADASQRRIVSPTHGSAAAGRASLATDSLVRALGCGLCHAGLTAPAAPVGPPLEPDVTRDADHVWAQLRPGTGTHPDFHLDDREAVALARFLGAEPRRASATAAREAGRLHERTSRDGERLFVAFNCTACHVRRGAQRRLNGPMLAIEGARVRTDWLRDFLRSPRAVRPFGVRPGDGGRMPRFALNDAEIEAIAAWLLDGAADLPAFAPMPLSGFGTRKTEELMRTRFSCLGCHRVGASGGRAGPDLTAAGQRLEPPYIRAILGDPTHVAPGTIMPATVAPGDALDAIASALSARTTPVAGSADRAGYLSPLDHPVLPNADRAESDGARRYATLCAACHGAAGEGDGFNAAFLRTKPANHTDARMMGARTDARLYDAIAGGARFLGGSPEMPGFASSLSADEIRDLVRFMRSLCACTEPGWAGDGAGARNQ